MGRGRGDADEGGLSLGEFELVSEKRISQGVFEPDIFDLDAPPPRDMREVFVEELQQLTGGEKTSIVLMLDRSGSTSRQGISEWQQEFAGELADAFEAQAPAGSTLAIYGYASHGSGKPRFFELKAADSPGRGSLDKLRKAGGGGTPTVAAVAFARHKIEEAERKLIIVVTDGPYEGPLRAKDELLAQVARAGSEKTQVVFLLQDLDESYHEEGFGGLAKTAAPSDHFEALSAARQAFADQAAAKQTASAVAGEETASHSSQPLEPQPVSEEPAAPTKYYGLDELRMSTGEEERTVDTAAPVVEPQPRYRSGKEELRHPESGEPVWLLAEHEGGQATVIAENGLASRVDLAAARAKLQAEQQGAAPAVNGELEARRARYADREQIRFPETPCPGGDRAIGSDSRSDSLHGGAHSAWDAIHKATYPAGELGWLQDSGHSIGIDERGFRWYIDVEAARAAYRSSLEEEESDSSDSAERSEPESEEAVATASLPELSGKLVAITGRCDDMRRREAESVIATKLGVRITHHLSGGVDYLIVGDTSGAPSPYTSKMADADRYGIPQISFDLIRPLLAR